MFGVIIILSESVVNIKLEVQSEIKGNRILIIYDRLRRGMALKKKELAVEFRVNVRTIQRDFDQIRAYLSDYFLGEELIYDYQNKGYIISNENEKYFSGVEIFALTKIVLESRAFTKKEMKGLIEIILTIAPKQERHIVKNLILNELFHFQELTHGKPILKMLWDLAQCVQKKNVIQIEYMKSNGEVVKKVVNPLSIVFSEYYFYLIAMIEGSKYKNPAFFRVDRIERFKLTKDKFNLPRFEEGELKKKVQFMQGGEVMSIQFIYRGYSIESVLDKFPTARVINENNGCYLIQADVSGKGCMMWLLSQGSNVELLSPESFRNEFKNEIMKMSKLYKGE